MGSTRAPPAPARKTASSAPSRAARDSTSNDARVAPLFRSGGAAAVPALGGVLQTKLVIGRPGDAYEREADAVADRVHASGSLSPPSVSHVTPGALQRAVTDDREHEEIQRAEDDNGEDEAIQRAEDDGEDEAIQEDDGEDEPIQRAEDDGEDEAIQRAEDDTADDTDEIQAVQRTGDDAADEDVATGSADPEVQRAQAEPERDEQPDDDERDVAERAASREVRAPGDGRPLEPDVRERLEPRMGVDLADVRVHDDARSRDTAQSLNARAFTHDRDIWLGPRESARDTRLLAHEVTHVLQQRGIEQRPAARQDERAGDDNAVAPRRESMATADTAAPEADTATGGTVTSAATTTAPASAADIGTDEERATDTRTVITERGVTGAATPEGEAATPSQNVEPVEPDPVPTPGPDADPRFRAVRRRIERAGSAARAHEPAATKVEDARAAVEPPSNERASRAQTNQVDVMAAQEPRKPETTSFLALLRAKLAEIAPKTLEEAHDFRTSGRAAQLKDTVSGGLDAKKEEAAGGIRTATQAEPDTSNIPAAQPTPLADEAAADVPLIDATEATPVPRPEEDVSVQHNVDEADRLMAEHDLDSEQLAKANEPQFAEAVAAKQELVEHAASVPGEYRAEEAARLGDVEKAAANEEVDTLAGMRKQRVATQRNVRGKQNEAKRKEEEQRRAVATRVESIYAAAKQSVTDRLAGLDSEVDTMFTTGEAEARRTFEDHVADREFRFYAKRYLIPGGVLLWLKDKLLSPPAEVNTFYDEGRQLYLREMDTVLTNIADTVELRLKEARDIVENARREISEYVASLPQALKRAGRDAERGVAGRFDELEQNVNSKKEGLASNLAQRYTEAAQALDKRISELKEKNKGLLQRLADRIAEIAKLLADFRTRIVGLLRVSGNTLRRIIKDPIAFLGNLLGAVKKGFGWFANNILKHLKQGLFGWLFGTLSKAGVEVPSEFSVKALFGVVLQVLGITTDRIRAKLVKHLGAKNVERVEKAWSFVSMIFTKGPAALWDRAKEFLGDFRETVLGQIRNFVAFEVIKAGVLWLVSLFNPASALLKAIQAIYNVIMFFVERIEQILQLVEAIVQSIAQVVAGRIEQAAGWIESSLGRTVPIMISFIARLLGLGGIAGKIRDIITSIQKRVDAAIDRVIAKIVKSARKLLLSGKKAVQKGIATLRDIIFPKKKFTAGGDTHTISIDVTDGGAPRVMISSQTAPIRAFLGTLESRTDIPDTQKAKIPDARSKVKEVDVVLKKVTQAQKAGDKRKVARLTQQVLAKENELAAILRAILSGTTAKSGNRDMYNLEGMVATYGTMPVSKRDNLTPDHEPQKAIITIVGSLPEFKGTRAARLAADRAVKDGVSINLFDTRHKAGRTWGPKGSTTKKSFASSLRSALAGIPKKDAEKRRRKAVSLVKAELKEDVSEMQAVYGQDAHFKDIKDDPKLVKSVKSQVRAGLSRIAAQDVSSLAK